MRRSATTWCTTASASCRAGWIRMKKWLRNPEVVSAGAWEWGALVLEQKSAVDVAFGQAQPIRATACGDKVPDAAALIVEPRDDEPAQDGKSMGVGMDRR